MDIKNMIVGEKCLRHIISFKLRYKVYTTWDTFTDIHEDQQSKTSEYEQRCH